MKLNCWMSLISDEKCITELTIPGTHNSGSMYDVPALPDTAKTQCLTIAEQLNDGVRFLDIRCKVVDSRLVLHNGFANQKLSFENIVDICQSFLKLNPSETIILELRDESYPLNNTQLFESVFNKCTKKYSAAALFFLENRFPILKEVRGKITLLRNFEVSDLTLKGIDKKDKIRNYSILKQNHHKDQTVEQKWHFIKQHLFNAKKDSKNILYMNYTSGYKKTMFLGLPSVKKISDSINPLIKGFFKLSKNARYGIIIMDYISFECTTQIINMNFSKSKVEGVIFFEDIHLRGNQTLPIPIGEYTLSELQKFGFNYTFTSSVLISEKLEVLMYEDDYFKGKCWTISKNDEISCNFTKFGYDTPNNKISSVIIRSSIPSEYENLTSSKQISSCFNPKIKYLST
jgi:1-phosphatidylinositol phosphodiesterase